MSCELIRPHLCALLGGLLWVACGAPPEALPSEEPPGTTEAELCSSLSVTSLTLDGTSSYQGELGGSGSWTTSTYANAVQLEYHLDGKLITREERPGASGTWYVSQTGLTCGLHVLRLEAWPMVIQSDGTRTYCANGSKVLYKHVRQECPTVAAGLLHTAELKDDGTVRAWGYNYHGQLGDRTVTPRHSPVGVPGLGNVIDLAAGFYHTVALKADGTVQSWGNNYDGQLGDGTTTQRLAPVNVSGLGNVVSVAAGAYHTVVVKQDGSVWAWGYNAYGQLGDSTTTTRTSPVPVPAYAVSRVFAGFYSTAPSP